MGNLHAFAPKASVEQNDVEIQPSAKYGPLFACLDDKEALKENPHLAFKDVIFEACTKADERNTYIVRRLRECLAPEVFKAWEIERRKRTESNKTWFDALKNKKGNVPNTLGTICEIFRNEYKGRLSYNELTKTHCLDNKSVITDEITGLREEIEKRFKIAPSQMNTLSAFNRVAFENKFHPVREYLQSCNWDGTPRLETVPKEALHSHGKLDALYVRKWAISAVARIMQPGCKVDTSFILQSPTQGLYKSEFFKRMAGKEYFSSSDKDIEGTSWIQAFHSKWIVEWAELERVTTKKGCDVVKNFQTTTHDDYRPPYAIKNEVWPRQFIVVGTTNKSEFLVDSTGSRRFWVIQVGDKINLNWIDRWRDQLWAEALFYYNQGEQWHLTDEQEIEREKSNAEYQEHEAWTEIIERWLARKSEDYHTTDSILIDAIQMPIKDITKDRRNRVGNAMRALGWEYVHKRIGGTKTRVWTRKTTTEERTNHA